jgi:hypothetical protein
MFSPFVVRRAVPWRYPPCPWLTSSRAALLLQSHMVTRVGEHCVGFHNGFVGCREDVGPGSICGTLGASVTLGVAEPESGFFLQQGYRQELSVDWPEAPQCPQIGLLDDLRQLRWHAEFAGELRDRCELLTAPVQPERREVVPVDQRAEVDPGQGGGCGACRQRLAEHVEVDSGAAGEQQSLAGSHGLAEPQQVTQQLGRVPGSPCRRRG